MRGFTAAPGQIQSPGSRKLLCGFVKADFLNVYSGTLHM
jgi:hypothetical protein